MGLALQSSPFAAILQNLVGRVATALGVDPTYVQPTANDDYKVTVVEPLFAYLRVFQPTPCDSEGTPFPNIGAGRFARIVARIVRVYVYTRNGADFYGSDTLALIGANPNQSVITPPSMPPHLLAEEIILNSLDNYCPLNSDGQRMSVANVQWTTANGLPVRKAEDEEGLDRSHLDFNVMYILAQQAQEPAPVTLPFPTSN